MEVVNHPKVTAWLTVVGVALATGVAVFSGMAAGGNSRIAVVAPVAVSVALALAAMALTRFRLYILCMLVMRSSIDLAKVSGDLEQTGEATPVGRLLDPSVMLAVLFLVGGGLWLAAQYRRQGRLPGSPLRRALLAFVAACLLSVAGSSNRLISAFELLRIIAVVLMFVVLEQMMTDRKALKQALLAVFLSTVFPLAFTAFGFLIGQPRVEEKGDFARIVGPFSESNEFGRYLMLVIIFGIALHPYLQRKLRWALAGILALSSVFLVLTYTRTAIVGTILGLLVVGLVQSKRLLWSLIAVSVCVLLLVPQVSARFSDISQTETPPYSEEHSSVAWRLNYWTEVLQLAKANPVSGIGLKMTAAVTDEAKQPHNDFLRAYVETGLIGLLAYLAMMIALVALGRRAVRASRRGTFDRGVAAGYLGCAIAFVAASLSANLVSNVVSLWYLVTFAAAASTIVRTQTQRSAPASQPTRGLSPRMDRENTTGFRLGVPWR
jgi:putative inorganic carbon (hco3(-)) transporter